MTSLLLCVYVPESNLEIKIGCDFFPKETGCDLRRHDTCTLDFTCAVKIDTVRARFGRSRPQTLAWCALSGPERCIFCFPFFRPNTKTPYSREQAQKGRELRYWVDEAHLLSSPQTQITKWSIIQTSCWSGKYPILHGLKYCQVPAHQYFWHNYRWSTIMKKKSKHQKFMHLLWHKILDLNSIF
jgi:hypothetical protein